MTCSFPLEDQIKTTLHNHQVVHVGVEGELPHVTDDNIKANPADYSQTIGLGTSHTVLNWPTNLKEIINSAKHYFGTRPQEATVSEYHGDVDNTSGEIVRVQQDDEFGTKAGVLLRWNPQGERSVSSATETMAGTNSKQSVDGAERVGTAANQGSRPHEKTDSIKGEETTEQYETRKVIIVTECAESASIEPSATNDVSGTPPEVTLTDYETRGFPIRGVGIVPEEPVEHQRVQDTSEIEEKIGEIIDVQHVNPSRQADAVAFSEDVGRQPNRAASKHHQQPISHVVPKVPIHSLHHPIYHYNPTGPIHPIQVEPIQPQQVGLLPMVPDDVYSISVLPVNQAGHFPDSVVIPLEDNVAHVVVVPVELFQQNVPQNHPVTVVEPSYPQHFHQGIDVRQPAFPEQHAAEES
ncbi:hypothetical protein RUM43_001770 [Polyplax serrata]|uniref:Uncharacterized protein n=1 Tax=Polyplax serrata TaxID=468196 RepID=A0AAN8SED7_POLSC